MKEKLDTLNDGMITSKQNFKKNLKQYKILIFISYSLIFFLSILIFNIYNKYINLLDRLNQIEKGMKHSSKDSENYSEKIKKITEALINLEDFLNKQNAYNKKLDITLEEMTTKIKNLELASEKLEKMNELNFNKNEIICKYEINDTENEIFLFLSKKNEDWIIENEEIDKYIEVYLDEEKIESGNKFKAEKPGIYTFKLKFLQPIKTLRNFFANCCELIYVDLTNFNSDNLIDISFLFFNCKNLKEIKGLELLNTKNVNNMAGTFRACENLKEINGLNNFITSNVISMYGMFWNCYNLENLDVSNFDTRNVGSFESMFNGCKSLKEIKGLNDFNGSVAYEFSKMFYGCSNLIVLDVSNFDTRRGVIFTSMFAFCSKLREIKGLNNFNTNKGEKFDSMFYSCTNLKFLDVSSFNTSKAEDMSGMFGNCNNLENIKGLNNFVTNSVISMHDMFSGCKKLQSLDLSSFNTSKVIFFYDMFKNCVNLKMLNLKNFEILSTNVCDMFKNIDINNCEIIADAERVKILFYYDEF